MADEPQSSALPEDDRPSVDVPPLPRLAFTDKGGIEGEPNTDVLIETENGLALRERMVEVDANAETALTAGASPTARSIVISNALLDKDGAVALDQDGRPRLSSRHEVVLTNEALGRLGTAEAVEEAMREAREIAAAKADIEFRGMALHDQFLAARTRRSADKGE